jgi:hypothetical protein
VKIIFLLSLVLLIIMMIISAFLPNDYQTKAFIKNAATLVKEYTAKVSTGDSAAITENAATNKPDENADVSKSTVIGHTCIKLDQVPLKWIEKAKSDLHIAYWHTSHGSQIVSGLLDLTEFKKSPYIYKTGSPDGSIDLRDNPLGVWMDLGSPNNKAWAQETRKYLEKNKDINVVMWSWCGQLSTANKGYVKSYLDLMQALEKETLK